MSATQKLLLHRVIEQLEQTIEIAVDIQYPARLPVQSQLGLTLKKGQATAKIFTVDSVDKVPTAN